LEKWKSGKLRKLYQKEIMKMRILNFMNFGYVENWQHSEIAYTWKLEHGISKWKIKRIENHFGKFETFGNN